jgi:hypothetical protein
MKTPMLPTVDFPTGECFVLIFAGKSSSTIYGRVTEYRYELRVCVWPFSE